MRHPPPPERPSILEDDGEHTVVDDPADFTSAADFETPTQWRCGRCWGDCVVGDPTVFAGGLPKVCAASVDGKWRFCARRPRQIVYYPDGV